MQNRLNCFELIFAQVRLWLLKLNNATGKKPETKVLATKRKYVFCAFLSQLQH